MRSLSILLCTILLVTTAKAQTFVNTAVDNKHVVLEEFTGIRCTYCPAGHKIGKDFSDQYPGQVVLINIHEGYYANPNPGQPDFRTPFGTALASQAGIQAYPSGTVNRRHFSANGWTSTSNTSMLRDNWTPAGILVKTEVSPVNVAAQSDINLNTRLLNVTTETYYTSNATSSTNKLNVALLQNNVPGPQSGASTHNPAGILPNGDYNHQHMLRELLTGQWGIDLSTTTTGYFQADSFNDTIPNDYLGIAVNPLDVMVAVFVAEGQEDILTGAYSTMNFTTPAGVSIADMSIVCATPSPASYCNKNYTPSVTLTNNSAQSIDSFKVFYISSATASTDTQLVTTPLLPNTSITVTFNPIVLGISIYTPTSISYGYEFESYNQSLIDASIGNNFTLDGFYRFFNDPTTNIALAENFQAVNLSYNSGGYGYGYSVPNAIIDRSSQISAGAFRIFEAVAPALYLVDKCFRINFFSNGFKADSSAALIFEPIDMTNAGTATLTFDYAHAASTSPATCQLAVDVSTDCGITWNNAWSRNQTTVPTLVNATTPNAVFYVTPSDYENITVDLNAYANGSDLTIRFRAIKGAIGSGNSLFLDNINLALITDVNKVDIVSTLRISPNPVKGLLNVAFATEEATDLNINIINALGQQVQHITKAPFVGENTLSVNIQNLVAGLYFLNITSNKGTKTERFVVKK